MTLLEAASSGVVQGITEFLPISSSGHLVLLHALFGFQEPKLLFDLCLHVGTTASILILFWRKILLFFTQEKKLLFYVLLGSLPTAAMGILYDEIFERFFTQPTIVGWGFFITAVWLFGGERFRPKVERGLTWWSALLIGFSQGIAMIPGISRSGATIATGLLLGLKGTFSVQFSFFLLIPAVIGGALYKILTTGEASTVFHVLFGKEGMTVGIGILTAMGVGILAIQTIICSVEKRKLSFFSLYLLMAGIVTFLFFGKIS